MASSPPLIGTYAERIALDTSLYADDQWFIQTDEVGAALPGYYRLWLNSWIFDSEVADRTVTETVSYVALQRFNRAVYFNRDLIFGQRVGATLGGGSLVMGWSDASIAPSGAVANGGVLYSRGGRWKWLRTDGNVDTMGRMSPEAQVLTDQVINTNSGEVSIFSHTVPAYDLYSFSTPAINRLYKAELHYSFENASGSNATYTFRLKYGATTIATAVSAAVTSAAGTGAGKLEFYLRGNGGWAAQVGGIIADGRRSSALVIADGAYGIAVEDATQELALAVTVQMSVSHADTEFAVRGGWCQRIGVCGSDSI